MSNAVLLIGHYTIPVFVPLLVVFVLLVLDFVWNRFYSNKTYQHPLAIKAITKSLNFLTIHGVALLVMVYIIFKFDLLATVC